MVDHLTIGSRAMVLPVWFRLCRLRLLSRSKFSARLNQAGLTPQGIVDDLRRVAVIVSPANTPRVVPTDPDPVDDQVITAAVAAHADLIVSGDRKHLLPLSRHQGIDIIDAAEAIRRIASG